MTIAAVQVRFSRTSQLPEDIVIGTFHFFVSASTTVSAQAATIAQKVIDFYKRPALPGSAITQLMSNIISRVANAHEVRVYDLSQPTPRQPVYSQLFTILAAASAETYPAEVSAVLSVKAPVAPGGNPKRHRGRLYIGPLIPGTNMGVVNGDLRISVGSRQQILDAALALMGTNADLVRWGVYSRVDQQIRGITSAYVDDAFDTQRRRGGAPTTRTSVAQSQV
jgi:hypothetical protein